MSAESGGVRDVEHRRGGGGLEEIRIVAVAAGRTLISASKVGADCFDRFDRRWK